MNKVQGQPLRTLTSERTLQSINQGKRKTHSIEVSTEVDGVVVSGVVKVHYASQMERIQIGVLRAHLLGGLPISAVDQMTDNLVSIISTLDVVVTEAPEWFDVYSEDVDYDLLEKVYLEYLEWVKSFRGGAKTVSDTGSSKE